MSAHDDPYKNLRKALCYRVADEMRAAALRADEWGHELREAALDDWIKREGITANEIPHHVALIGMRKESWP